MTQTIKFSRSASTHCPRYKDFYIQDRFVGKDIYGNDAYEYALFRSIPFQLVRRFRTRKQAYVWLSNLTGLSEFDIRMGNHRIVCNDRKYLGVLYGNKMYRLHKPTCEVFARPDHDEQISVWFDKFAECVAESKTIIKDLED